MTPEAELDQDFFRRDTAIVARELIGKRLVRTIPDGRILEAEITETEAYRGYLDTASHGSRGPTDRNRVMFQPAGGIYVYFIYGLHFCLNIVTEEEGFPAAVLIRSARLIAGDGDLLGGPALVCRGLQIDRRLNGSNLGRPHLIVQHNGEVNRSVFARRVGVDQAGQAARWAWRCLTPEASFASNGRLSAAHRSAGDAGF